MRIGGNDYSSHHIVTSFLKPILPTIQLVCRTSSKLLQKEMFSFLQLSYTCSHFFVFCCFVYIICCNQRGNWFFLSGKPRDSQQSQLLRQEARNICSQPDPDEDPAGRSSAASKWTGICSTLSYNINNTTSTSVNKKEVNYHQQHDCHGNQNR